MSSKRRLRRRACENKQAFPTHDAAQGAAYSARRGGIYGLAPYHCQFRDHWHIGHPPRAARQGMTAQRRNREKEA